MFNIFEGTFLEWLFPSYLFGLGFGGGKKSGGGGQTVTAQPMIPGWQMALGEDLSKWTQQNLKNYTPGQAYGGKMTVTQPSNFEQIGLNILNNTLTQPALGSTYTAANNNIMDTLNGKFADPANSPFIQAATKLAGQNLQDSITQTRGQRGARGTYFTRAGLQDERLLGERTQNNLNGLIADYINQERGRQLQAAPIAKSLEEFRLDAPLKQTAASQTFGALPRILEQADLDKMYQDYVRGREELSQVPQVGASVFGRPIQYGVNSYTAPQQSSMGLSPFLQLGSTLLGGLFGLR